MRAMVLEEPRRPLVMRERPLPEPAADEILLEVAACGVCRTDLHLVDGELPNPKLPVVPGHEIVGRIAAMGEGVTGLAIGQRIGVPWLVIPAASAPIAGRRARTCAIGRYSPATPATAATRPTRSPTRAMHSRCRSAWTMPAWRRFCAPG